MLYRRGQVWWVKFEHAGTRYRFSTGSSHRRKAEVEGARLKASIARDALARPRRGAASALDRCAVDDVRGAQDRGLSPGQVGAIESMWRAILAHYPDGATLEAVTHASLVAYEGARRASGVRGQTIRKELHCLRRAFRRCSLAGQSVEEPRVWPRPRRDPPDPRRRGKLVEDADLLRFLAALPEDLRDELTVARLTGLRQAELHRLTIGWLSRDGKKWLLRVPAEDAKTRTERAIDLPDEARRILERRAARIEGALFPRSRWSGREEMAAAATEAGLARPPTLRDLRASYATVALERSGDAAAVMAALGHTDLRTTAIYQRTTIDRIHRVGDAAAIRRPRHAPGHSRRRQKKAARRKNRRAA